MIKENRIISYLEAYDITFLENIVFLAGHSLYLNWFGINIVV